MLPLIEYPWLLAHPAQVPSPCLVHRAHHQKRISSIYGLFLGNGGKYLQGRECGVYYPAQDHYFLLVWMIVDVVLFPAVWAYERVCIGLTVCVESATW